MTQSNRCSRQLVADDATHTVYITGVGKESVIWVVDGTTLKLKDTIANTGTYGTGLALDAQAKRLYTTNADGELVTIDTASNKSSAAKRCRMMAKPLLPEPESGYGRAACLPDRFKTAGVLVVSLKDGSVIERSRRQSRWRCSLTRRATEAYVTHREAGKMSVIDTKTTK